MPRGRAAYFDLDQIIRRRPVGKTRSPVGGRRHRLGNEARTMREGIEYRCYVAKELSSRPDTDDVRHRWSFSAIVSAFFLRSKRIGRSLGARVLLRAAISARLQSRDVDMRGEEATPIRLIRTEVSVLADMVLTIWRFLHAIRWDGEVMRHISVATVDSGPH